MSIIDYIKEQKLLDYNITELENQKSEIEKAITKTKKDFLVKCSSYIKGDIIRISYSAIVKGDYNYPTIEERYILGADIKIHPETTDWELVYLAKRLNKDGNEDKKSTHIFMLWHTWLEREEVKVDFINLVPRNKGILLDAINEFTEKQ